MTLILWAGSSKDPEIISQAKEKKTSSYHSSSHYLLYEKNSDFANEPILQK